MGEADTPLEKWDMIFNKELLEDDKNLPSTKSNATQSIQYPN